MQLTSSSVEHFVKDTLRRDGVTVLRLIRGNCGDYAALQIVHQLWQIKHGSTNYAMTSRSKNSANSNMKARFATREDSYE